MALDNNYTGLTKLKDWWGKVKANFTYLDNRISTIITTPAEGVSAQEIIDARKGETALGDKIDAIDSNINEIKSNQASHKAETVTNVKNAVTGYGAVKGGTVDCTEAIQNAINDMQEGDTFILPPGDYLISNVHFDIPTKCTLIFMGRLISNATSGIAVKIGSDDTFKKIDVKGLDVRASVQDWSNQVTGIQIMNIADSTIEIKEALNFYKNIEFNSKGSGNGTAYNKVYIGRSHGAKKALFLTASDNGFCNENSFYGGEFKYNGVDPVDSDCVLLTIDYNSVHKLNNNHFYSPSFEAGRDGGAKAAVIEGSFNQILYARVEQTGVFELTENSTRNTIILGYDDFLEFEQLFTDNGQDNWFQTSRFIKFNTQAPIPAIDIGATFSGSQKMLSFRNTVNNETFYVNAAGMLISQQYGYFTKGLRWLTSSGTYNDRGLFVGTGSPEGVIAASPGSLYLNASGGAGETLYVKETGAGNTGWIAK